MTDIKEDHNHSDTELHPQAQKLILHGDNDSHLYQSSTVPIRKNLNKKIKKGVYDHEKAKKLWGYHADRAAQSYTKEHGHAGQKWHELFSTKHRKAAAAHWADEHHEAIISGDKAHMHEDESFASEIVFAAMSNKPVDANINFKNALVERSQELVADTRVELAGKFMDEARKPKPGSPGGSWVPPAVADRFKKQAKEKKQFASAKREIDQLKRKGK